MQACQQCAAGHIVSTRLRVQAVFEVHDPSRTGRVTLEQFESALHGIHASKALTDLAMELLRSDQDRSSAAASSLERAAGAPALGTGPQSMQPQLPAMVPYHNFVAAMLDRKVAEHPRMVKRAFVLLDTDSDGTISSNDIVLASRGRVGSDAARDILAETATALGLAPERGHVIRSRGTSARCSRSDARLQRQDTTFTRPTVPASARAATGVTWPTRAPAHDYPNLSELYGCEPSRRPWSGMNFELFARMYKVQASQDVARQFWPRQQ